METVVKFKADASDYNSAIRVMVAQNSALARSLDSVRRQNLSDSATLGMGGGRTAFNRSQLSGIGLAGNKTDAAAMSSATALKGSLTGLATAGAAVVAVLGVQLARSVMTFADQIQNASNRTGMGVEELQRYKLAAEQEGSSIEAVAAAYKRLRMARAAALEGKGDAGGAFETLGLSAGTDTPQLLDQLSAKFKAGELSAMEYGAAIKLLGKNADEVIAILRNTASSDLTVATAANIKAVDDLGDAITKFYQESLALGANAVGGLMNWLVWGGSATPEAAAAIEKERKDRERAAKDEADQQAVAEEKSATDEEKRMKDKAKLQDVIDKESWNNSWNRKSTEEKRQVLNEAIAADSKLPGDDARLRVIRNQGRLDALKDEASTVGSAIGMQNIGSDSMRRIGLFVGGGVGGRVSPEYGVLKEIRTAIKENTATIKETF